jgi:hypothetical protein
MAATTPETLPDGRLNLAALALRTHRAYPPRGKPTAAEVLTPMLGPVTRRAENESVYTPPETLTPPMCWDPAAVCAHTLLRGVASLAEARGIRFTRGDADKLRDAMRHTACTATDASDALALVTRHWTE